MMMAKITLLVDNLTHLSSQDYSVACLLDGNGGHGDKIAETGLSSVLEQCKELREQLAMKKALPVPKKIAPSRKPYEKSSNEWPYFQYLLQMSIYYA